MKKIDFSKFELADVLTSDGFKCILEEIKTVGGVLLVGVSIGEFKSDTSGQTGSKRYDIQGDDRIIKTGAKDLAKLCLEMKQMNAQKKPVPYFQDDKVKKEFNKTHAGSYATQVSEVLNPSERAKVEAVDSK